MKRDEIDTSIQQEVYVREKIKIVVSCTLILVCLPYLITYFFQGEQTAAKPKSEESSKIAGILASQVPVNVEEEALKAQAVIVRTQLAWCEEHEEEEPESLSKKEMEQLWGQEKYYEFYEKMIRAAEETDGQVMTFDKKVINPSFHKVSAGTTRDGSQIYKDTPYLLSVSSQKDVLADDYLNVQFFTQKEFDDRMATLLASGAEGEENQDEAKESSEQEDENQDKEIEEYLKSIKIKTDGAGYVTKIKAEGEEVDVDAFVKTFELPSSCFALKAMDGHIRIVTKGCGHGFGLSQYGANEMAKEKKSYDEILKYYFSGIKIEKSGNH